MDPGSSIEALTTPDGVDHVYSGTSAGLVFETYWGGGNSLTTWQLANDGTPVTAIIEQETAGSVQHVYSGTSAGTVYDTSAGTVYESYWGGGNSLTTWQIANIGTAVTGIASDMSPADGVEHVFTGGADGSLHETYWGPGNSLTTWQITNLDGSAVDGITGKLT